MTPLHLAQLAAIVAAGSGLYLILGFVFRVEEVWALWRLLRRKLGRQEALELSEPYGRGKR